MAVDALLKVGANPLVKSRDGKTPREVATTAEVIHILEGAEKAGTTAIPPLGTDNRRSLRLTLTPRGSPEKPARSSESQGTSPGIIDGLADFLAGLAGTSSARDR